MSFWPEERRFGAGEDSSLARRRVMGALPVALTGWHHNKDHWAWYILGVGRSLQEDLSWAFALLLSHIRLSCLGEFCGGQQSSGFNAGG